MKIGVLHRWPRTSRSAIELQKRLAPGVRLVPIRGGTRTIAGLDVAFSMDGSRVIAGAVVYDLDAHEVVERKTAEAPCRFPYVPGLLSFRELPAVLAAIRKLRCAPDAFLCDGQGLAHPRRFGLACHLGLWVERPTVGCAKSRLCGSFEQPGVEKGSSTALLLDRERIGTVVRTRERVKPVFVSPGHLCDHDSARRLVLAATTKYRIPEPTRLAHRLVTQERQMH